MEEELFNGSMYIISGKSIYRLNNVDPKIFDVDDSEELANKYLRFAKEIFRFTKINICDLLNFLRPLSSNYIEKRVSNEVVSFPVIFTKDETLIKQIIIFTGVISALKRKPSKTLILKLSKAVELLALDEHKLNYWYYEIINSYNKLHNFSKMYNVAKAFLDSFLPELEEVS